MLEISYIFLAKYMFVVGGGGGTEIVPISEDTQIPDCLSNLKDHPDPVENSAGGALPERGKLDPNMNCC